MDWLIAAAYGAVGGFLVELIVSFGHLTDWQSARRRARLAGRRQMPALTKYVDPVADPLVAASRVILGAGGGFVFHAQVTGAAAAITVGACAPALLRQMSSARTVQHMLSVQSADRQGAPARPRPQRAAAPARGLLVSEEENL
ncbi:hypothetical protein [Streptomyces sp. NPDC046985]|uniref:hypothetical protein n=1 Tax=Streptomyces sp. NPDC046985 TaxID=3155377 RepID=UPI0033EF6F2A